jgi:PAS domain S-box-containing protein
MTSDNDTLPLPDFTPRLYGITALVLVIIVAGGWLVGQFSANAYQRDEDIWREKLNLIAESRATDVENWVTRRFSELRRLSDNPSLQLYLTTLQTLPSQGGKAIAEDEAQKAYLRNLLLFTAERDGFGGAPDTGINANVAQPGRGALAVLNAKNAIVISTGLTPSLQPVIVQHTLRTPPGKESLIDLYKDASGQIYLGFVLPVYAIQGDHTPASQIGHVVGLTVADAHLFGLLKHPGIVEKTLEGILVRPGKGGVDYLSPLMDGSAPLARRADDANNAALALMREPGNFVDGKVDYRGKPVLATSRAIANTPWVLVVKVDRAEALIGSAQHRLSMIVVFVLLILVIVLIVVAVWWQSSSHRALLQSRYFRRMAQESRAQERLLQLVTDNQNEPIYIVDTKMTLYFANRRAAEEAGMQKEMMTGKPLSEVRGAGRAQIIAEGCKTALEQELMLYDVQRVQDGAQEKTIRFGYIPVADIPLPGLLDITPGVLVVEQDITGIVRERERRAATLRQLVRVMIKLVDKRDPFAANHSLLVSELAFQVAAALKLDPVMTETTRTAARLMNIGKIVVPIELLTKTKPLTAQEKQAIQESMSSAARLVAHIDFDGPVAETLRQWQERWDGAGPLGLQGEDILISARIVAPANAFIGMISPRSWRDAMPIKAATEFLLNQAGTVFDRNVVIALIHYVENQHGKQWIEQVLEGNRSGMVNLPEDDADEGLL